MNLKKKWKRYSAILREVKNWPSYFSFKSGLNGGKSFLFSLRHGMKIEVDRNMLGPFRECFFDRQYTEHPFTADLPSNPVILDVGANVGFAALSFFYKYPDATIHSFEPMPYCIGRIEKYKKEFPQFQWTLYPQGFWSHDGEVEIFTQSSDGFSTTSGISAGSDNLQKIKIKVMSPDTFFDNHPGIVIDLVKMDCEGAEYETLFNMNTHHLQRIQRIAMETHRTGKYFTSDMVSFLENHGFETDVTNGAENGYIFARQKTK